MEELVGIVNAIRDNEEAEIAAERPPRHFHPRDNPFELADRQFVRLFRLTKNLARFVIGLIQDYIPAPSRASALDAQTKVLVALRFFATGSYQMDAASNIYLAVSQSSVSRAIHEVIDALNNPEIFNRWIRFPRNIQEMNLLRNEFYNKFGFPGVIGCIDCTHVAIFPPKSDDPVYPERIYVNRKGYHSINVQLVCDSNLTIININARYPGSSNDAFIWNNSNIQNVVRNLYRHGHSGYYVLGDSGYPLRPWCLTPLENEPGPDTPEEAYNICHRRTRNLIERCNGLLKMRFRCLLKHRVLHYAPNVASKIINACAVLHNMCIDQNEPLPEEEEEQVDLDLGMILENDPLLEHEPQRVNPDLAEARRIQQRLILNYFR